MLTPLPTLGYVGTEAAAAGAMEVTAARAYAKGSAGEWISRD